MPSRLRRRGWPTKPSILKAASYFPSLRSDDNPSVSMFIQDVSLGLMPMRVGTNRGNYKVRISGKNVHSGLHPVWMTPA
jgi:hypothetical protein